MKYAGMGWPPVPTAYVEQWPILAGWRATGAESFGSIRFHKYLEMADPQLQARLYLIQHTSSHRIGIEVRHEYFGVATCGDIGVKATCSPDQLNAAWRAHIDRLIADVQRQYREWVTEIDEAYRIAEQRKIGGSDETFLKADCVNSGSYRI